MLRVCEAAAAEGLPVFLFGSTDATLVALQGELTRRFPALKIAGARASRFREVGAAEADADAAAIRASGARLVFCGLGCPRQEHWVHAMRPRLDLPLVAVGAAFALWAGERPMAPGWMQRAGLEWLYRLAQEPRRLAFRYLVYNPWFVAAVLRQKISATAYPAEGREVPPRHFG
jgi:exopolysaccharide biosynthesis WecB/TagA/CpsF family protein